MTCISHVERYGGDSMDAIVDMIQKLGFPIACVIALFWQNTKLNDQHKEEMKQVVDALNNNTLVLTELKDAIGGIEK